MKRKAPKPIILTTGESISVADKSRASGATISQPGRSMASVPLEQRILTIRGHKVVLDADLSALYGSPPNASMNSFAAIAIGFRRILLSSFHQKNGPI